MNKTIIEGYPICEEDRKHIQAKDLCGFCHNIVRNAIQTECGHRYCSDCIEREFNKYKGEIKCVVCNEKLTRAKIFRDKFADREILQLILLCIFCDFGCKWKGRLYHREEHHKTCKFTPLNCTNPGCDQQLPKDNLTHHLQNECLYREEQCLYCVEPVIFKNRKDHEDFCPNFRHKCEFCKNEFFRDELMRHKDPNGVDACPALLASCAFKAIGCKETKMMNHKDRLEHQQSNVVKHLNMLLVKVQSIAPYLESLIPTNTRGRNKEIPPLLQTVYDDTLSQVKVLHTELEQRIKTLERETKKSGATSKGVIDPDFPRRMENLDAKAADLEFLLNEAHDTIAEQRQELTRANVRLEKAEEIIRKLERRIEEQESLSGIRSLAVADLEERMNSCMNIVTDGILIWKIDQVAKRRTEASSGRQISFYSPPFYSDPYGYKMCARIYLEGDGMGKGNHISLFFVVMRGEHDALLKWPFKQKVTMMLLDQDSEEHVIDAFRPDPTSSSFQRPKGAMNIASGCPMFCPHSELQRHAYIRDDVMFIKVIVDRPDWK